MSTIISRALSPLFNRTSSNRSPNVGADRVEAHIATLYALVEQLTPQVISMTLNQYLRGELKAFALLWRDIRTRDDRIPNLEEKRIKSVSRLPYEIVALQENSKNAERQKEVVSYFLDHLRYTDCMNREASGGFNALVKGIMLSIGYGWSVQEIVWKPSPKGLTAELVQIPLECFRQEKGTLTYLPTEYAVKGVEMLPSEWLVSACSNPIGIASMILYYYKRMPLKDWLIYCKRYVIPALQGKTNAAKGTTEWDDLRSALGRVGQDWAILTGKDVELLPVQKSASGPLPYSELIDRCDRCLTALWRGADLSTMSSKDAVGATLQQSEQDTLTEDDASYVADVFNHKLLPQVLRNTFGDGVDIEIRLQLSLPKKNVKQDMEIDKFFIENGVPVGVADLRKRYGRAAPDKGDEVIEKQKPPDMPPSENKDKQPSPPPGEEKLPKKEQMPNAGALATKFLKQRQTLLSALSNDLSPLRNELESILELQDTEFINALREFKDKTPELFKLMEEHQEFEEALINSAAEKLEEGIKLGQREEGVEA